MTFDGGDNGPGGQQVGRSWAENLGPTILGAAAGELRQANVTILNGSEGLGDLVAGLASQATSILDIVRRGNGKFSALVPVSTADGPPAVGAGAGPAGTASAGPPS